MKMMTYNIRGLGSKVKRREIKKIIRDQETKLEVINDVVCKSVWGEGHVEWAYRKAEGRAGGFISLWDYENFVY
ncbi:hypothetical protein ACS0TY_017576 [Phlomoides rotata]